MNLQNRKVKILIGIIIAAILIISYRIFSNIQSERERATRMSQGHNIQVVTEYPQRVTITPGMNFSGSLDPEWQADVAAKVDGRIEKVYVREGDEVIKGQVLAILEQTDTDADLIIAQGAYYDAQTNLRKAESDLKRHEALFKNGAVSEQAVENYRFARDNAAAKLESARGTLQGMESKSSGTVLTAPADGIVAKRYYQEGYYAKAGTPVISIADISRLKTVVHIPEGQISSVAVGTEAYIKIPAYSNKEIIGKITRIAPVADLPSHTFEAEVSVENDQQLRAGVYANVSLIGLPKTNVLTIPLNAIVMRDDQQTVYVANAEGIVQRRVLNIGYTNDQVAEVLSGLTENDLIVVEGHHKLREGSKINMDKAGK